MRRGPTLLALLAGCAVSLLAAEAVLRAIEPRAVRRIEYPCIYRPDARFGFSYEPGATWRRGGYEVSINSLGFRDAEPLPPGRARLRVLAVGDSFTAALGVPQRAVWTAVLERRLRERGHADADVVNLGLDGTGTDVHVDLLRAYLPRFHPQVVLVAFFANDLLDVVHGRFTRECYRGVVLSYQDAAQREALRARVERHRERRLARWAFDHLFSVRLAVDAWLGPGNLFAMDFLQPRLAELGLGPAAIRARRPRVRAAFAALEEIARDCHCRLFVAPVPPRGDLEGSRRALRRVVGDRWLEVIDVVPAMRAALERDGRRPSALHYTHDAHLNGYGNRLYAEALADAIDWDAVAR